VPQGITDLASLWFRVQEKELTGSSDPEGDYIRFVAPTKVALGLFYAEQRSFSLDLKIIAATFAAVFLKADPTWCFPNEAHQLVQGDLEPRVAQIAA
jgi:lipopolysaccharide/colanic/teichoic acid biosynthesis glycosyltransferase